MITGKIEKLDLSMPNNKMLTDLELIEIKINELVDAVNELMGNKPPQAKGKNNE